MISRFARVAILLFCIAHFNSFSSVAAAPSQQPQDNSLGQTNLARVPDAWLTSEAQPQQKGFGTVSGRIEDQNGNVVAGTNVQIRCAQECAIQEMQSDQDGRFSFYRVPPGPFQLTITGEGFVTQTISNTLRPGEDCVVPPIVMSLALVVTEVRVSPLTEEIGFCSYLLIKSDPIGRARRGSLRKEATRR